MVAPSTPVSPILPALQRHRIYHKIADIIVQFIEEGRYPVGSQIPPERELAKQLNVSRASVREALIALEVKG